MIIQNDLHALSLTDAHGIRLFGCMSVLFFHSSCAVVNCVTLNGQHVSTREIIATNGVLKCVRTVSSLVLCRGYI